MAQPFFSIIVPVYKAEAYLRQCVDSLLKQTFSDLEVILVEDGSPDNCGAICDEYAALDTRVKVIHKENGGNVSARKAGLAASRGKYIVHVDSDDYIDLKLLAAVERAIQTHHADAVLFGFQQFSETGSSYHKQGVPPGVYSGSGMDTIRQNLILGSDSGVSVFGSLCLLVIKRELFTPCAEAVPETIYRGEDQAAVFPALASCDCVVVLDMCGYFYRTTPGSIMQTVRMDEVEQALKVADYLSEKMGPDYQDRLNTYVLVAFCHFLNQIVHRDHRSYRSLIQENMDAALRDRLKRAKWGKDTHITNKVVFFLMKHRCFSLFWIIKRIRRR